MYTYVGYIDPANSEHRDFLPGIPARNITDAEATANGWTATLTDSAIYTHA